MSPLGSTIRAIFAVSLSLLPGAARAQARPPAAAFPAQAAAPANAAAPTTPAPEVGATPPPGQLAVPASPPPALPPSAPPPPAPPAPLAPSAPPAYPGPNPAGYPPPGPVYYPPYGYYYPPPPPGPPPPRYPADAAVRSTPFIDAIVLVADWEHRFSENVNLGAQAGLYVVKRLRLTAKLAFPTETSGDAQADYNGERGPSFVYALSAGFAAVRTPTFVMSPGVMFARTDVSNFGTMLAVSLPFDWVLNSGLRLGLEGGLGQAFGGKRLANCSTSSAMNCSQTEYESREAGLAYWLQFQIGFGFNHPGPLPPEPAAQPAPATSLPPPR